MRAMTPKAARNSRSKSSVSGTLAALPRQATGTPSPLMAMWYLLPLLARSVGLGPTRSPPRLARTEQLSRIRVGLPRSIATSSACTLGQHRVLGPEGQEPPQGRAAGLLESGAQAAPWQALTQEPAQGGNPAHDRAARMARPALRWWFAHNDEVRNQVQKSEIQHVLPYPNLQIWEARASFPAELYNRR